MLCFIDGRLLTAMANAFLIPFLPFKLHETNLRPKSFLWIYALIPKSFVAKFGLIPKSLGCLPLRVTPSAKRNTYSVAAACGSPSLTLPKGRECQPGELRIVIGEKVGWVA